MFWVPFSWSNKPRSDVADGSQSIFTRLTNRYRLTDAYPGAPVPSQLMRMSKTILPVSNMDALLESRNLVRTTVSVTAVGTLVVSLVPAGMRRRYSMMSFNKTAGTWTLNQVLLSSDGGTTSLKLIATPGSVTGVDYLPKDTPFIADSGWSVCLYIDACGVAGTVQVDVVYEEESAY